MHAPMSAWLAGTGATMSRWWRTGNTGVSRALQRTAASLKHRAIAFLEGLEKPLLNARSRERIHAGATFALIFAFAFASVDFLVAGGGFDFGAPARAAEAPSAVHASLNAAIERNRGAVRRAAPVTTQTAQAARAPEAEPLPAVLSPALVQVSQASVVEVGQRLDATLEPEATSRTARTHVPIAPLIAEAAELRGAETQDAASLEQAKPTANGVTKS